MLTKLTTTHKQYNNNNNYLIKIKKFKYIIKRDYIKL